MSSLDRYKALTVYFGRQVDTRPFQQLRIAVAAGSDVSNMGTLDVVGFFVDEIGISALRRSVPVSLRAASRSGERAIRHPEARAVHE